MIKLTEELLNEIVNKYNRYSKVFNIPVYDYKKNQVGYLDGRYYYSNNRELDGMNAPDKKGYAYSWCLNPAETIEVIRRSNTLYIRPNYESELTVDGVEVKGDNYVVKLGFKFSSEDALSNYYYDGRKFQLSSCVSGLLDVEGELFKFKGDLNNLYRYEGKIYLDYQKIVSQGAYYCGCCEEFHSKKYICENQWDGFGDGQKDFFFDESRGSQFRVGLEIEKDYAFERFIHKDKRLALKRDNFKLTTDGSCGTEVVSPILDLYQAEEYISKHKELVEGPISNSCGGHIHISEKDMPAEKLLKSIKEYRPILWAIYPERVHNRYCRPSNFGTGDRYADMALSNYNTIEIRIFPGLNSNSQLKFRLELIKFFVENKVTSKADALHKIFNEKVIDFINVLHIVYLTAEEKLAVIQRIAEAYEVPDKRESIIEKTKIFCDRLGK